ncbi:hypothetical protein QBC41DRAFT_390026 [Cercophora samala]|uniref:Uncharacterized protein n=1 Tax=Cercophora samala TaxID=330535 RepID=A0AA39ZGK5_9PEZI|nr:hypothetical protein QBC41DRAFT_390026 [Cercophora samala]
MNFWKLKHNSTTERENPIKFVQIFFEIQQGTIASILYGGIHFTARGFAFPTHVEAVLWKVSSITMMPTTHGVLLVMLARMFMDEFANLRVDPKRHRQEFGIIERTIRHATALGSWLSAFIAVLMLLAIATARVYILVESFISLRAVPLGVYYTPSWIQMMPHF